MWTQVILAAITAAPDIIFRLNELFAPGEVKHAAAVEQLKQIECVPETPAMAAARDALIKAQVAYANALQRGGATG